MAFASIMTSFGICVCVFMCVCVCVVREKEQKKRWRQWWALMSNGSQSRFFQVIEVWQTWPGGASEAMPILASLYAHLLWIGVAFWSSQGRRVPARLQLRVRCLTALELGCADSWVSTALCKSALSRGWIGQRLVVHVRGRGLTGGRGGEV